MKLLFDQNISFRIIKKIIIEFPEAKQVRELDIEDFSDLDIWNYAKENGFSIITFDADFFDLSSLKGHPPKIIWLRFGNSTTETLASKLISKKDIINDFINSPHFIEFACLEIK